MVENRSKARRNYALDAIKIVFAVSIAMGHFERVTFLPSNTVVQVFFILSGFFLMQSYSGKRYEDAYQYTKARIKRIYPYYICAFLLLFVYCNRSHLTNPLDMVGKLTDSLPEMLLLQNVGIFNGGINYPLWQLCVLIVVSHIWFALLCWDEKVTINVLCPVVAITTITFLANVYNTHAVDIFTVESKMFYVPLLRAAGFVAVGMLVWRPVNGAIGFLNEKHGKSVIVSLLTVFFVYAFWKHAWDYVSHIAFVGIMLCALSGCGLLHFLLDRKIFKIGEKLSLSIYVNHALWIYVFRDHILQAEWFSTQSDEMITAIFVIILLIVSWLFVVLIDGLSQLCGKWKAKRAQAKSVSV